MNAWKASRAGHSKAHHEIWVKGWWEWGPGGRHMREQPCNGGREACEDFTWVHSICGSGESEVGTWDTGSSSLCFLFFFFPTAANLCTEKNSLNQHRTHIKVRSSLIEFSFLERSRRKGLKRKREQEAQHFTFYACWSQFQVFLSKIFMSILPSKEVSTRKLLKFKSAHCDHTYHFTYRKPKYNKEMIVAQRTQIWTG